MVDAVKTPYEEIVDASTKEGFFTPKEKGETEPAFHARLLEIVAKLSDAGWASLSAAAQGWYNTSASSANSMKPVPSCPGFQSELFYEQSSKIPVEVENTAKPEQAKPVASTSKKRGVMQRARELSLADPSASLKTLLEQLKSEGWEPSENSTWVCYQEVHAVLKAAETIGYRLVKFQGV